MGESFRELREGAYKVRKEVKDNKKAEQNYGPDGVWGPIDSPLSDYFVDDTRFGLSKVSFGGLSFGIEELKNEIASLQEDKKKVVVLDVFGQGAAGVELGADYSIGWTLTNDDAFDSHDNQKIVAGDLMDKKHLYQAIKNLDDALLVNKALLHTVFFRPFAGICNYENNLYAQSYLHSRLLRPVYERLMTDVRIFIEMDSMQVEAVILKRTLSQIPSIEIEESPISDAVFVLTKKEGAPKELPEFIEKFS